MKKSTRKYLINILLIATLTIFVFYFSFKGQEEEMLDVIGQLDILKLGVCVIAILCVHGIVGYILSAFAKFYNSNYTWKSGFQNALIAVLFHGITPFASGGQFIQAYVFHKDHIDVGESASILLMDFIVYQTTLVIYTFCCVILQMNNFITMKSKLYSLAFAGFLINFCIILFVWLLSRSISFHKWMSLKGIVIAHKLHLIKDVEETRNRLNNYIEKFNIEVKRLATKPKLIIKVVVANILRLTLYFSIPFLCAWALGIPLSLRFYFDSVALASFISMINSFIPLPGASGGTEGTFIILFGTMVGRSQATGMMLVWRMLTYYFMLLIGLVAYGQFKRKHTIRQIEEEIYENRTI